MRIDQLTDEISAVVKGVVELGDPLSIADDQNLAFLTETGRIGSFHHLRFAHDLHGEVLVRVFHLHQHD